MKKIINGFYILLVLNLFQLEMYSQSNNDVETLFGQKNIINTDDLGYFIAPQLGLTQIDGSMAALFQLRSGINIKDKYSIGAYFNISLNEIYPESEILPDIYMDYWSVGGFFEYTLYSKKLVHITAPIYFGYGEVEMDDDEGDLEFNEENFFQVEPSLLVEVNLHRNLRLNVGAGYRFVSKMNYRNISNNEISGFTGYIGLKFGIFN